MPRYTSNPEKNVMIPLDTPSCEGGLIHVPSRIGGAPRASIQSKAMVMRHVPFTDEEIAEAKENGTDLEPRFEPRFDPTAAAAELLVQSCVDKRAYTNLTDNQDRPVVMTRGWVEVQMDEDDFLHLAQVLFFRLWEQIPGAGAPEGEAEAGDSPLASAAAEPETSATAGDPKKKSKTS